MSAMTSWGVAFLAAIVLATFVEYWGHRLMHMGWLLRRRHGGHHARNTGQGVLGELRDYFLPTLPLIALGFLVLTRPGAWGFATGAFVYAFAAAYAHQLQHERPDLCFWMERPVHRMHHDYNQSHHNFGILFDGWDRVFGTWKPIGRPYRSGPWPPVTEWLKVHWLTPSPPSVAPSRAERLAAAAERSGPSTHGS